MARVLDGETPWTVRGRRKAPGIDEDAVHGRRRDLGRLRTGTACAEPQDEASEAPRAHEAPGGQAFAKAS